MRRPSFLIAAFVLASLTLIACGGSGTDTTGETAEGPAQSADAGVGEAVTFTAGGKEASYTVTDVEASGASVTARVEREGFTQQAHSFAVRDADGEEYPVTVNVPESACSSQSECETRLEFEVPVAQQDGAVLEIGLRNQPDAPVSETKTVDLELAG